MPHIHLRLWLLILLSGWGQAATPPATGTYCIPLAFRDRVVGVGYQAVIRAAPGCTKPALVRKQNRLSGSVGSHISVPLGEVRYAWLVTHHLYYTLDGVHWHILEMR